MCFLIFLLFRYSVRVSTYDACHEARTILSTLIHRYNDARTLPPLQVASISQASISPPENGLAGSSELEAKQGEGPKDGDVSRVGYLRCQGSAYDEAIHTTWQPAFASALSKGQEGRKAFEKMMIERFVSGFRKKVAEKKTNKGLRHQSTVSE